MANFIPMIGLDPAELVSVRTLVYLLRHPDPVVPELALQALSYLEARASGRGDWIRRKLGRLPPSKIRRKWCEPLNAVVLASEFTWNSGGNRTAGSSRGG